MVTQPLTGSRARLAGVFWLVSLVSLGAGAWLACPQDICGVGGFDRLGLEWAATWRSEVLDSLVQGGTWLGSLWLLLPAAVGLAGYLYFTGRRREGGFALLALLTTALLSHVTKLWLARPRPDLFDAVVAMPADWSYPSAHAMQAAAFALALLLVAGHGLRRWWPALALVVTLVGFSRIYLQVHYPTDVLAGLAATVFWVTGLHILMFGPRAWWKRSGSGVGKCVTSS
jgi:undecaprenyl-diphosphatase